jgi:hypothetical protein
VTKPYRVAPTGELVLTDLRCEWLGNRGCLHRAPGVLSRPWAVMRWITCVTSFKDRRHPLWGPGRYTPLFLFDEAVALAAGHRPCAECRRPAYRAFRDAWNVATGEGLGADAMDLVLHRDRRDGDHQRTHVRPWREVPTGTFVASTGGPAVVLPDAIVPWAADHGYGAAWPRPGGGDATVLTPSITVDLLAVGYGPQVGVASPA